MSNRSGSPYSVPTDANRHPFLVAASTADGITPVVLEADPTTHLLQVSSSGGSGGTQYTDGSTAPTHPIGNALTYSNGTNMVAVSSSNPLPTSATLSASSLAINDGTVTSQKLAVDASGKIGINNFPASQAVTGTFWQTTQPVSGTITANIGTTNGLALDATLTGGSQQTKITDGTNIANTLKSDGTAAGQNAQLMAGTYLSSTWSVTTPQAVVSTDAGNYKWVSVQITAYTSGTINFQGSNDNSTWSAINLSQEGVANAATATSAASASLWTGPLNFRYFRLSITGSGSTNAGTVMFFTYGGALATYGVAASQSGTWTVGSNSATGSAVPANAFYIGVSGSSGNLTGLQSGNNVVDSSSLATSLSVGTWVYNGTNWDRTRSAATANNTTGTGLLGAGTLSVARTALPSAASATNYVTTYADKFGRQVVIPQTTRDLVGMQETTITSSTASTTVVTAGTSGIFNDITSITLANSSASATLATLSDGTNSYQFYVPAGDMRGAAYQVPLAETTAATAWTVTCGTSVASLYVTVTFVKNQ